MFKQCPTLGLGAAGQLDIKGDDQDVFTFILQSNKMTIVLKRTHFNVNA